MIKLPLKILLSSARLLLEMLSLVEPIDRRDSLLFYGFYFVHVDTMRYGVGEWEPRAILTRTFQSVAIL